MSEAVSIVLVHGAWADGSSWAEVIRPLQAKGYRVVAAPIPLTSLTDDVAALDRVIGRTEEGPVILVAHAYAGSASTNKRVKSLVFVAALTPDEGETVADVFYREKPHPNAPQSIAVACIQERAPKPAWRSKPSFYLIAEDDRMINPATQHFHGQTHGSEGNCRECRLRSAGHRSRPRRRYHPCRCCRPERVGRSEDKGRTAHISNR
jgi:pimeloyl-ACP methyl ester carboxylesterase